MGQNQVEFTITAKNIADAAFKAVGKTAQDTSKIVTASFKAMSGPLNDIKGRVFNVKTGLASLFAVVGGVVSGGSIIKVGAEFEDLGTALKTTEGSSKAAQKSLDWITQFTAKTPYQLDQVGEAYQRLSAYGIDAQKNLRTLGDASASLSKPFMAAIEMFADAAQGEFERLKEFGITASQAGDKVTFSWVENGKQMQATSQKTQQSIIELLRAILDRRFHGGMENFGRNFTGIASNLRDQWTMFLKDIAQAGPFDRAKSLLQGVFDEVKRLREEGKLKEWAEQAGQAIVQIGEKSFQQVKSIGSAMFALLDEINRHPEIVEYGVIGYFLRGKKGAAAGAAIGAVWPDARDAFKGSDSALEGIWNAYLTIENKEKKLFDHMFGTNLSGPKTLLSPDRFAATFSGVDKARNAFNELMNSVERAMQRTGTAKGDLDETGKAADGTAKATGALANAMREAGSKAGGLGKALEKMRSESDQFKLSIRTPAEIYAAELGKYQTFLDAKLISTGQFNQGAQKLQKELFKSITIKELESKQMALAFETIKGVIGTPIGGDSGVHTGGAFNSISSAAEETRQQLKKTTDEMSQFAIQAARNVQTTMGDGIYNYLSGRFDDIGQNFRDTLVRMGSDILSSYFSKWLFGSFGTTGEMGGFFGMIGSKIFHSGGVVGKANTPTRMINPSIFAFAPKLHSGLAPDEFPAILQRGETVIPKDRSVKSGVSVSIPIHVELPNQAISSGMNPAEAKYLGTMIGQGVKAEVARQLNEHLRPGGLLNRGI